MTEPYLPVGTAKVFVNELSEGFWDACRRAELTVQCCRFCGHYQHPPRVGCANCQGDDLYWARVPGTGVVYSYTIVHHGIGELAAYVPFTIVVVELDESGTRLVSNLVGVPPDSVTVGLRVMVTWQDTGEFVIPRFRPAR
ncbi:MAG TPA: OB-fold domain-containing protein [Amycolatopsis sp.]|nr:OB-fold domain-containing protein [Amycolatopsis sp.]